MLCFVFIKSNWQINGVKLVQSAQLPSNYRPIELFSVCFKLLERVVLRRISDQADEQLSMDQAGQRRRQSTGTRGAMGSFRGAHGECVEREPIMGVWGQN